VEDAHPRLRDNALPPLALAHVVENRDGSRRLHNPTEPAHVWQLGSHTTLPRARSSGPLARLSRSVLYMAAAPLVSVTAARTSLAAGAPLFFATIGGLQEGKLKLSIRRPPLLRLRVREEFCHPSDPQPAMCACPCVYGFRRPRCMRRRRPVRYPCPARSCRGTRGPESLLVAYPVGRFPRP